MEELEQIVHCNIKENAEIIARILDYDVDNTKCFCIESDGTLMLDLPISVEKVKRINLMNSSTHIGDLYYVDSNVE